MKSPNRDLLVLARTNGTGTQDQEIEQLNELLCHVESMEAFCVANEVINLNRHRISSKPEQVKQQIGKRETSKPFVFINNKN
jgi:hypothetical protein